MWNHLFVLSAALVALALTAVSVFNRRSRRVTDPQGLPGRGQSLFEVAFLSGGPARVADTALVRMEREGRVVVSRARRVTVTADRTSDPVERVLVTAVGGRAGRDLSVLRACVMGSPEVQKIGDGLAARGLLRDPAALRAAWRARRLLVLALLTTLVLGAVSTSRWLNGPEWESTVPPFFPYGVLVLFTLVSLAATSPGKNRITPAGLRQLELVRGSVPWRPREVEAAHAELVGAFALDGVAALREPGHRALREAITGPSASTRTGRSSGRSGWSTGTSRPEEVAAGYGAGAVLWCGTPASSCGSSGHSGSHSGGHSGGSHHSCGGSSSHHSCGGSSHSCGGSSSSCGGSSSSCGGGGCGGS
ncbi:TIGR04222 domain-containing membrane protein [Kitasatospora phosalacinea]|uniref:TIGR04222 domain-containing membrane protein n=1 Tax=Kitasatospora phosalacinea TaxID=2065 RepID=UPI0005267DE5|nr:TIGR04222 domain-containing membrane protein [Kitasatospora phosalacinea]